MSTPSPLLNFDDPPVVETVLGVEFASLDRWSIPHFGLFWNEIRSEYPRHVVQAASETLPERFGEERTKPQGIRIELLTQPRMRCWFHDASESRLIQVQSDRFAHNWRKRGPTEEYPRYDTIRPRFEAEWRRFCAFVEREQLGEPSVSQCEVTYVNQIEQGPAWSSLGDLSKVVTFWTKYNSEQLPEPEGILTRTTHILPNLKARFYVELQHAVRADLKEVLQLSLTVRGRPTSGRLGDVLSWMDEARKAIVLTFVDLTTPRMHQLWKRRS